MERRDAVPSAISTFARLLFNDRRAFHSTHECLLLALPCDATSSETRRRVDARARTPRLSPTAERNEGRDPPTTQLSSAASNEIAWPAQIGAKGFVLMRRLVGPARANYALFLSILTAGGRGKPSRGLSIHGISRRAEAHQIYACLLMSCVSSATRRGGKRRAGEGSEKSAKMRSAHPLPSPRVYSYFSSRPGKRPRAARAGRGARGPRGQAAACSPRRPGPRRRIEGPEIEGRSKGAGREEGTARLERGKRKKTPTRSNRTTHALACYGFEARTRHQPGSGWHCGPGGAARRLGSRRREPASHSPRRTSLTC